MVLSLHQGMFWEGQACPSQTQVWDGQALGRWLRNAFGTAEYKLFGSWFYEMEHWLKYRSHFGSRYHTRADAVTQAFFPWWVFDSQHHLLSGFQVPMCIQMIHEMAELKAKGPIVCKHPWNKSGTYLSNYRSQFLRIGTWRIFKDKCCMICCLERWCGCQDHENVIEKIVYTSRFVRVILAQGPC